MPIYEYECLKCHLKFDAWQGYDDPPKKCPRCQGKTRIIIHPVPFIMKGDK